MTGCGSRSVNGKILVAQVFDGPRQTVGQSAGNGEAVESQVHESHFEDLAAASRRRPVESAMEQDVGERDDGAARRRRRGGERGRQQLRHQEHHQVDPRLPRIGTQAR